MSLNRAMLIGNVCSNPDVKHLESGISVATFTLATNEKGYKLASGTEVPPKAEFHNIVAWRGLATIAERYIKKGSQLYIEGKITTRSWEKDGITRYTTEIVAENIQLLGSRPSEQTQSGADTNSPVESPITERKITQPEFPVPDDSDDLPF
jgi:single-strand DNA-binding protein